MSTIERSPEEKWEMRQYIKEHYSFSSDQLAKLIDQEAPSLEFLHLELIRLNHHPMKLRLDEIPAKLKKKGEIEAPSLVRLRAEFLKDLAKSWDDTAVEGLRRGDFACYIFFGDVAVGADCLARFLIEADALNIQKRLPNKSKRRILPSQSGEQKNTREGVSTDNTQDIFQFISILKYAESQNTPLSEEKTIQYVMEQLQQLESAYPHTIPYAPELVVKGAEIGIKILDELRNVQGET